MTEGHEGGEVTGDGSPVPVFLALPAGEAPRLVHAAVPQGASLLELGCGAGRVTRPLVAMGHRVVAVDDSLAMLRHVTGARRVCADLFSLELRAAFDAVVVGSYMVNTPDVARRHALLGVARRHVGPAGVVLVQRHDPEWLAGPADSAGPAGPVDVTVRVLGRGQGVVCLEVGYVVGGRSWTVPVTAAELSDDGLAEDAAVCGLRLDGFLDERRTWARLRVG